MWRRNNHEIWKTHRFLWEKDFTRYYLQESSNDWIFAENSEWFSAAVGLSQRLKKDNCNVREIKEDAAKLYRQFRTDCLSVIDQLCPKTRFLVRKVFDGYRVVRYCQR